MTLDDLTLEMMELNETAVRIDRNSIALKLNVQSMAMDVYMITDMLKNIFELEKNKFDYEKDKAREDKNDNLRKQKVTKENDGIEGIDRNDFTLAGLLGAFTGFIAGTFDDLKEGIKKAFGKLKAKFVKFFDDLPKPLKDLKANFKLAIDDLKVKFNNIRTAFTEQLKSSRLLRILVSPITFVSESFSKLTKGFKTSSLGLFSRITKAFGSVIKTVGGLGSGLGKITSILGDLSGFKKIFGIFKAFGRVFTPLFTAFEIVTNIFGELDKLGEEASGLDKFVAIIKGAIKGLLSGLVTGLLDLIKDGASYVLKFFGFDEMASELDSFSFVEIGNQFIDGVFKFFDGLIKTVTDYVDNFTFEGFLEDVTTILLKVVTAPWTLLKNAVAWFAGLLGFDNFEKDLNEFDIVEEIKTLFGKIWQVVKDGIAGLVDMLPSFDDIKNFFWGDEDNRKPGSFDDIKNFFWGDEDNRKPGSRAPRTPERLPIETSGAVGRGAVAQRIANMEAEKQQANSAGGGTAVAYADQKQVTVNNSSSNSMMATQNMPDKTTDTVR